MNRAYLIVCMRSELRKQNMTFHKLPGSTYHQHNNQVNFAVTKIFKIITDLVIG